MFEKRRGGVEQAFQVLPQIAVQAVAQHPVAELDQARVAAGEDAQGRDARRGLFNDAQHPVVVLPLRIAAQEAFQFLLAEAVQRERAEEVVESLVHCGDGLEITRRRADHHAARVGHPQGAEGVQRLPVVDVVEDVVEVVDEQQGAFAGFRQQFKKPLLRPVGEVVGVFVQQLLAGLAGAVQRGFQMADGFQPEIRQVADAVLLLLEQDRQPFGVECRVAGFDAVLDRAQQGRLAHATRADDDDMLLRLVRAVMANDVEYALQHPLAVDEFGQQHFGV